MIHSHPTIVVYWNTLLKKAFPKNCQGKLPLLWISVVNMNTATVTCTFANTLSAYSAVANELFECVWPHCGVGV